MLVEHIPSNTSGNHALPQSLAIFCSAKFNVSLVRQSMFSSVSSCLSRLLQACSLPGKLSHTCRCLSIYLLSSIALALPAWYLPLGPKRSDCSKCIHSYFTPRFSLSFSRLSWPMEYRMRPRLLSPPMTLMTATLKLTGLLSSPDNAAAFRASKLALSMPDNMATRPKPLLIGLSEKSIAKRNMESSRLVASRAQYREANVCWESHGWKMLIQLFHLN